MSSKSFVYTLDPDNTLTLIVVRDKASAQLLYNQIRFYGGPKRIGYGSFTRSNPRQLLKGLQQDFHANVARLHDRTK